MVGTPNVAGGYVAARLCQAVGDRLVANRRHTFQKSIIGNGIYLLATWKNMWKGERVRVSLRTPIFPRLVIN